MKADKLAEFNKLFDNLLNDVLGIVEKGSKGLITITVNHSQGGVGNVHLEENTKKTYK